MNIGEINLKRQGGKKWRPFSSLLGGIFAFAILSVPAAVVRAADIAVLDSGLWYEIKNNIAWSRGWDFVGNDPYPFDWGPDFHGSGVTLVAQLYNNKATIVPVRIMDNMSAWPWDGALGVLYAAADKAVKVINISWGSPSYNYQPLTEALIIAVKAGKLLVMAAGNEGAAQPVLPAWHAHNLGAAVAVGAVDDNGKIRDYSNRAGATKNNFMVAHDGYWNTQFGTSFSAPAVSGVAALVFDRDPHLTAGQVAQVLFRSADDLGAPGVDDIYGQGLLNPGRAMSAIGISSIPVAGQASGQVVVLRPGVTAAGAAFAPALRLAAMRQVLSLDEFGRSFPLDLSDAIRPLHDTGPAALFFSRVLDNRTRYEKKLGEGLSLRFSAGQGADSAAAGLVDDDGAKLRRLEASSFSLKGEERSGLRFSLAMNEDGREEPGLSPLAGESLFGGDAAALFNGFSRRRHRAGLGFALENGRRLDLFLTRAAADDGLEPTGSALRFQLSSSLGSSGGITVAGGYLREEGSFLGGADGGLFGAEAARTFSLGTEAGWKPTSSTRLFGQLHYGRTVVRQGTALLGDFSPLHSTGWRLGGSYDVRPGQVITLALSSPLAVVAGDAVLTVPLSRDVAGNITSERKRISLAGGGGTDLECSFGMKVGGGTAGAAFLRRDAAGGKSADTAALAYLRLPF